MQTLRVFLPLILLFVIMSIAFITHRVQKSRRRGLMELTPPMETARSLYFKGLIVFYTFIVSVGLSPFRCFEQEDGTSTLVASSSLNCYDANWRSHGFTIALGVLEIIAIPGFLTVVLWKYRTPQSRMDNIFNWRYGILVNPYKPKYFWWALFLLLKRTVLVMVIDLTNSYSPFIRVGLVLMILFIGMTLDGYCQPYFRSTRIRVGLGL
jgi:hypothetical protein